MISVNLSEMERLKDLLFKASSQADEGLYILKKLQEETDGDLLLKASVQSESITGDLITAANSLSIVKETLFDLGRITSNTTEEYRNREKSKVDLILRNEED